ncbi:MAG: hypothetical protein GY835_09465 [bacterium]|nr:hypothetical protein [bacterium]
MNAKTMVASYGTFGGHMTISIVGQLIEDRLSYLGHGISDFESVACFRTKRPPRRTLEKHYSSFHEELSRLPKARWESRKSRLTIRYESQLGLAEKILEDRIVSLELFSRALDELISVVVELAPKLQKKRALNVVVFLDGLRGLSSCIPGSSEELTKYSEHQTAEKREELSKLPWDEQLGIDWNAYHSTAKELMDNPLFWRASGDFSPHGNDTGADLLVAYTSWNKRYPDANSQLFLEKLLSRWGMADTVRRLQSKDPSEYSPDDEISMTVLHEALVALAFAELKLRGKCSSELALRAQSSFHRQQDPVIREKLGWPAPTRECVEVNKLLSSVLSRFTAEEE